MSWRETYPPHPAADLFPMLTGDEMDALVEDVRANGILQPIVTVQVDDPDDEDSVIEQVLDGRNRLEAAERAGLDIQGYEKIKVGRSERVRYNVPTVEADSDIDPFAFVISANIRRRHLSQAQRRDLIAKLLKLAPERSDRQTATEVGVSPTTVGKVRHELESNGDVSNLDTRTDARGRKQPATKPTKRYKQPDPELAQRRIDIGLDPVTAQPIETAKPTGGDWTSDLQISGFEREPDPKPPRLSPTAKNILDKRFGPELTVDALEQVAGEIQLMREAHGLTKAEIDRITAALWTVYDQLQQAEQALDTQAIPN